ncbi:MAG: hypothetical protein ACRD44_05680 [Bryobacteraceae bacterium]
MPPVIEKLTTIWSSRRERQIAVRVSYTVEEGDCKVYRLNGIDELD